MTLLAQCTGDAPFSATDALQVVTKGMLRTAVVTCVVIPLQEWAEFPNFVVKPCVVAQRMLLEQPAVQQDVDTDTSDTASVRSYTSDSMASSATSVTAIDYQSDMINLFGTKTSRKLALFDVDDQPVDTPCTPPPLSMDDSSHLDLVPQSTITKNHALCPAKVDMLLARPPPRERARRDR